MRTRASSRFKAVMLVAVMAGLSGERAKLGDDLRRSGQRPAADFRIAEYRDVRKRFVDAGEVTPFGHHAVERR